MKKGYVTMIIVATIAAAVALVTTKEGGTTSTSKENKTATVAVKSVSPVAVPATKSPEKRVHAAYKLPAPIALPSGTLSANFPSLESQALAGNPRVAYALAMELFSCAAHSQNDANRLVTDPSTTFGERCKGLTNDDYSQAIKLLTYAADSGDVNAQNAYMSQVGMWMRSHPELKYQQDFMSSYVANSLAYLRRAASSGNVDAMMQIAQVYDAGIITPRDASMAYAYVYAINKTGLVPSSQRMLAYWQGQFTAQELTRGASVGDQIFKECCSN